MGGTLGLCPRPRQGDNPPAPRLLGLRPKPRASCLARSLMLDGKEAPKKLAVDSSDTSQVFSIR